MGRGSLPGSLVIVIDACKAMPLRCMTPNAPACVPKDAVGYDSHVCEAVCKERRTLECEEYASGAIATQAVIGVVFGIRLPISPKFDRGRIQ